MRIKIILLVVIGIILFTPTPIGKIGFAIDQLVWGFTSQAFAEEHFFEIKAKKFSYTPNIIRVKIGDKVKIRLISEDVTHGIFVDGYGVETRAYPGQDGSLSFMAKRPGRFTFRCSVTCGEFHPYMVGYLVVGPNVRFYLYALLVIVIGIGSIWLMVLQKG